jgi:hypothetical protein
MNAGNHEVWMPNPYVGRSDLIFCNHSETPEQNLMFLFSVITVAMWCELCQNLKEGKHKSCVCMRIDYSNMFTDKCCFYSQRKSILNFCVWKW